MASGRTARALLLFTLFALLTRPRSARPHLPFPATNAKSRQKQLPSHPLPPREPHPGDIVPGFENLFSVHRRSHIPAWCPEARFDHYYRFATNTRVASGEAGKVLHVGDRLVL